MERIHAGCYGKVFKAIDTRSQEVVAVKILKPLMDVDHDDDVEREVAVLFQCDSPYVTKFIDSYREVGVERPRSSTLLPLVSVFFIVFFII